MACCYSWFLNCIDRFLWWLSSPESFLVWGRIRDQGLVCVFYSQMQFQSSRKHCWLIPWSMMLFGAWEMLTLLMHFWHQTRMRRRFILTRQLSAISKLLMRYSFSKSHWKPYGPALCLQMPQICRFIIIELLHHFVGSREWYLSQVLGSCCQGNFLFFFFF